MGGWGGGWHKASVSDCLPLAAPIGLSALLILTLCGPERVLVVSTEPLDDLLFWGGGVIHAFHSPSPGGNVGKADQTKRSPSMLNTMLLWSAFQWSPHNTTKSLGLAGL